MFGLRSLPSAVSCDEGCQLGVLFARTLRRSPNAAARSRRNRDALALAHSNRFSSYLVPWEQFTGVAQGFFSARRFQFPRGGTLERLDQVGHGQEDRAAVQQDE